MHFGHDCIMNPNCKSPTKKESLSLGEGTRIQGEATGRD